MYPRAIALVYASLVPWAFAPMIHAADSPSNPLFEKLRTEGVSVTSETKASLAAPLMVDGLDTGGQRAILQKIVGNRFTVKDFTGKVGTAPHVYHIRKIPVTGIDAPRAYGVDVFFIAHGSLDKVADKNFLEDLHKKHKDRKLHILTAEEMEKRKLRVESSKQREERYSHGVFLVLERVELSVVLHTIVTRQPDSLVAASRIDPRFLKDSDFPNQWRKISLDDEGQRHLGSAQPYAGAGGYLKITRLHEPKGALFIEYHLVYTEPKGWFNGTEALAAKLPAIIQSEVRTFRRELNKIKK